jgi:WD40 repeat protein
MSSAVTFSCAIFDLDFHPRGNFFAVGLVDGRVELHAPPSGGKSPGALFSGQPHRDAVRSLRFTSDGASLVCGSADATVSVLDGGGRVVWARADAHPAPVNVVAPLGGGGMMASGDEGGLLRLWDVRAAPSSAPPVTFDKHTDVLTALLFDEARGALLAASGDGTLGVFDVRRNKLLARTPEGSEEELLSLALLKSGTAVVAGTQDGVLLTWEWGQWAAAPERFTGHPESIDSLARVDEDTVVTASSDGLLRLVTLRPNKLVGVIGEHGDDPVERLAWSHNKRLLGSVGHDDAVRLWDTAYLFEEEEEGGGGAGGGGGGGRFTSLPALALPRTDSGDEEGEEDTEEEEEEEEEEDDDDNEGATAGGGGGGGGGGGMEMEEAPRRSATAVAAKKKKSSKNTVAASKRQPQKKGGGSGGFFGGLD